MNGLYDYPKSTLLKRVVPKTRIYDRAKAGNALKDKFIAQVDQILWRAKLAPETINLPATKAVPEIQVFRIRLKTDAIHDDVLKAIDRAIPFPILFELEQDSWDGGQIQTVAAHKRPSEADARKWVLSDYMRTDWLPTDTPRSSLPVALNLGVLYEQILTALMPIVPQAAESLTARIERTQALKTKEREIGHLKSKLKRETQFNIKMKLNGQLREAHAEFEHLKKPE